MTLKPACTLGFSSPTSFTGLGRNTLLDTLEGEKKKKKPGKHENKKQRGRKRYIAFKDVEEKKKDHETASVYKNSSIIS